MSPNPAVRLCPKCKQELPDNVRFCPNDGTPLIETAATRADSSTPTGGQRPVSKEITLPVLLGDRYRLDDLRGGGGMAKVYRAYDQRLEREVAVKVINPELRNEAEFDARFQREAKIASQLADANIVRVYDFGLDAALGPFLVMEFLQGQSVRERLVSDGPLPVKAVVEIAGKLFIALMHAHDKGIVHRDIKPDNLFLVDQSGVKLSVRVLDFGIARIYRRDESSRVETITRAGAVLGTPRYMSPEQLAGNTVDAKTDLYSAALVIFESLTGQLPYAGSKRLCELCPDAPESLQEVLEHCLKPDPTERPDSALEVYIRLQEAGKASGILMMPPGGIEKLIESRRKRQPIAAGDATVALPGEDKGARTKRRVLVGVVAVIALLAMAALVKWMWVPSGSVSGPETVLGIGLGQTQQQAAEHVPFSQVDPGHPWKTKAVVATLGKLLAPEDLGLSAEELGSLTVRRSEDNRVAVVFHKDKVIAVVTTRDRARTNRGVGVGSGLSQVAEKYDPERYTPGMVESEGKQVELRRYPGLGLGFEAQAGRVTVVVIYPPVKQP